MKPFAAQQTSSTMTELGSFGRRAAKQSSKLAVAIALHGSGSSGGQWSTLREELQLQVFTPDLTECGSIQHWRGDQPFRLADEARPIVALIDALEAPAHLIGHSYGGGVALRIAVERPTRIASLTLYEPTAFHVLKACGDAGHAALKGIRALAEEIEQHLVAGTCPSAARRFVDYWNGPGTFGSLTKDAQEKLSRYIPKVPIEFRALIGETTPLMAFRKLRIPLLIICGEHGPTSTQLIARKLATVMNPGSLRMIAGAGHMGPFTHGEAVVENIIARIVGLDQPASGSLATSARQAA
jgi:pimeloyl-ACP methyl ester carboxylesterase